MTTEGEWGRSEPRRKLSAQEITEDYDPSAPKGKVDI